MYGDLVFADGQYDGSKCRRWKVDWVRTPQPIQIKLKCLRGVKNKLPGMIRLIPLYLLAGSIKNHTKGRKGRGLIRRINYIIACVSLICIGSCSIFVHLFTASRYVLMATLYSRLGGHVMKWANLKGQQWGGATLPISHDGEYYNIELTVSVIYNGATITIKAMGLILSVNP